MTVLLGLGIYALIGAGYVLFWALVLTCLLVKYAYLGGRYLYRRHKAKKEAGTPAPTLELPQVPRPYMSEYHSNGRS